jgi:hypothetical protein
LIDPPRAREMISFSGRNAHVVDADREPCPGRELEAQVLELVEQVGGDPALSRE